VGNLKTYIFHVGGQAARVPRGGTTHDYPSDLMPTLKML
jgi:hypothetical protein